ncbi:tripartite tricarboxylate transporter substrate-binding protein [Bradyrhizobium sp.]|uniref:tripartite tricarboxylate transporter substrate-binding protein n=1 Tax=Bradyrhizobium sp. TaxID=376 RepID=UPI003BB04BF7
MKVFAVTSGSRSAAAPEIPTADEAGLPGFHFSVWNASWAPKGTPIIARSNGAIVEALADPNVRARLAELGQEIFPREHRHRKRCARFRKRRSRNGGQLSRTRGSMLSDSRWVRAAMTVLRPARSAVGSAPRRRGSLVEEDSTQRVVD